MENFQNIGYNYVYRRKVSWLFFVSVSLVLDNRFCLFQCGNFLGVFWPYWAITLSVLLWELFRIIAMDTPSLMHFADIIFQYTAKHLKLYHWDTHQIIRHAASYRVSPS